MGDTRGAGHGNDQIIRIDFHSCGGEMAKQKQYPEVYLGDPEIDFAMLARSQGIHGTEVRVAQASRPRCAAAWTPSTPASPISWSGALPPWAPTPPRTSASS